MITFLKTLRQWSLTFKDCPYAFVCLKTTFKCRLLRLNILLELRHLLFSKWLLGCLGYWGFSQTICVTESILLWLWHNQFKCVFAIKFRLDSSWSRLDSELFAWARPQLRIYSIEATCRFVNKNCNFINIWLAQCF